MKVCFNAHLYQTFLFQLWFIKGLKQENEINVRCGTKLLTKSDIHCKRQIARIFTTANISIPGGTSAAAGGKVPRILGLQGSIIAAIFAVVQSLDSRWNHCMNSLTSQRSIFMGSFELTRSKHGNPSQKLSCTMVEGAGWRWLRQSVAEDWKAKW